MIFAAGAVLGMFLVPLTSAYFWPFVGVFVVTAAAAWLIPLPPSA